MVRLFTEKERERERERERELTSSEKVVELVKTTGKPWEKKKDQKRRNGSY
jgi:hypothetical protein